MSEIPSFGTWLKRRRKALDLTQDALARRVGCSVVSIRKFEGDEQRPSHQLAELLAAQLQIAPEERATFIQFARLGLDAAPPELPLPAAARLPAPTAPQPPSPVDRPPRAAPSGTVTFLFTDIEASTRLWEQHPQAMPSALARHDAILSEVLATHAGVVVKRTGDGLLAAFAQATAALGAARTAQQALQTEDWRAVGLLQEQPLRVRMVLHTGVVAEQAGDYVGPPLNRAARLLAVGHGGQIVLSRATWELVADQLPADVELRDLGVHRLKDLSRPEHIFQLVAPDLPADFPALRTLDAHPTNLPAQPTALIGREREVATLLALLRRADVRLVTLTGPGGVGKTRLALQVAAEVLDAFVDGAYFVALAPLSDPDLVIATIAQTLEVREASGQPPIETLKAYLREKQLLLVLDNFEQVVAAAPQIGDLLAACPRLQVLVTSREVLRLSGEHSFLVPPLALPDLQRPPAEADLVSSVSQYAAVALFIERAQAARADFAVTNASAPAVAEICVRLDGLPLAIELAAARIKLFAPEALLKRLEGRLGILTGGPRDAPARQQTIRNTIDWSHQLLDKDEQLLFIRLGVFVGGWTLEAAEAVGNAAGDLPLDVMDGVTALVDKSLLRQEDGESGEPRFTMLETIREYALERLAEHGEEARTRQRHAAYFLALAEQAALGVRGPGHDAWLRQLDREHDNLRTALAWSLQFGSGAQTIERGDVDTPASSSIRHPTHDVLGQDVGLGLAGALWWFWWVRGFWREGQQWLDQALAHAAAQALPEHQAVSEQSTARRARGLCAAGLMSFSLGDLTTAQAQLDESKGLFRTLDDRQGQADTLLCLTFVAHKQSDHQRAVAAIQESLVLYRALEDHWGIATTLDALAYLRYIQGDLAAARAAEEESLILSRALRLKGGEANALSMLGMIALTQHDAVTATALIEEALLIHREHGDRHDMSSDLNWLGEVAYTQGDYQRAESLWAEALALRRELGDQHGSIAMVDNLARVALRKGDLAQAHDLFAEGLALAQNLAYIEGCYWGLLTAGEIAVAGRQAARAAQIFGAAEALRTVHGLVIWPERRTDYDHAVAGARTQLDEDAFDAAWAAGRAMSLEQAIAEVLCADS